MIQHSAFVSIFLDISSLIFPKIKWNYQFCFFRICFCLILFFMASHEILVPDKQIIINHWTWITSLKLIQKFFILLKYITFSYYKIIPIFYIWKLQKTKYYPKSYSEKLLFAFQCMFFPWSFFHIGVCFSFTKLRSCPIFFIFGLFYFLYLYFECYLEPWFLMDVLV